MASVGSSTDVRSIRGIHGYSDKGGLGSVVSVNDPRMFAVSTESTDTLNRG